MPAPADDCAQLAGKPAPADVDSDEMILAESADVLEETLARLRSLQRLATALVTTNTTDGRIADDLEGTRLQLISERDLNTDFAVLAITAD